MQRINIAGITGFFLCFVAIIFGVVTNGGIQTLVNYLHLPSLILTVGGALFAVLATADSFNDFTYGIKGIFAAYQKTVYVENDIVKHILEMSDIARKEGLLMLEADRDQTDNEFMKKGIRLIVDGTDPELVKDILETEMYHKEEQEEKRIKFWQDFGAFAPAWGMVGTLLGLISMMRSMGTDVSGIGSAMSLALITTLYGSILANWICIPIARKLGKKISQESLMMEVIIEGILSIQAGENPRVIKEKIRAIVLDEKVSTGELTATRIVEPDAESQS